MQVFQNGYGETVKLFEVGDKAMFTSHKWTDLKPYEVTISGIYSQYDKGFPAYLRYVDANGNDSGWETYGQFAPIEDNDA
jgi:hypothetical protein